jgi:hypothetical protein
MLKCLAVWVALSSFGIAFAAELELSSGTSLLAQYNAMADRLQKNQFQRPLYLDSSESKNDIRGDIYAVVDYPFSRVSEALKNPDSWCDMLILHINTKYCYVSTGKNRTVLMVSVGAKSIKSLKDTYPIELDYRVAALTTDYLEILLNAEKGPLSTRDYRIQLQVIPVENGRTFLHLTYSYAFGFTVRIAMRTYLATIGREKVGFTLVGGQPNAQPKYIGGMRGMVERNAMRTYLAIGAFLDALAAPPAMQLQKRLHGWFSATEQYPRQLFEIGRIDYIDMKQGEYLRQQKLF